MSGMARAPRFGHSDLLIAPSVSLDLPRAHPSVCADQEAAKRVTFEGKVRSVTLEGDVYEPSGTISGGSATRGSNILVALQQLQEAQAELATHQAALATITAAIEDGAKKMKQARETQSAIELQAHELALAKQQLAQSPHAQAQSQLASLRAQVLEHQAVIDSATQREKEAQAEVKRIEKEMKELSENREGKLKALKGQLTKLKQELTAFTRAHKEHQQQQDTLKLEIGTMGGRTAVWPACALVLIFLTHLDGRLIGRFRARQARRHGDQRAAQGRAGVARGAAQAADGAPGRARARDRGLQRDQEDAGGGA